MKTIISLLFCMLLVVACTQKNNSLSASSKSEQIMDTLIIDTTANHKPIRTDERIDVDEFAKEMYKYKLYQILSDGTKVRRNIVRDSGAARISGKFTISKFEPTGYVQYKTYHANGVLKSSLSQFRGARFGFYSEYDSLGYLVKRIDYDKGYTSIEKMVEKFKAQTKMDLYTKETIPESLETFSIGKVEVNNNPYFLINITINPYNPNRTKTPERIVYFLEGSTGNIVCERRVASKEIIEKRMRPGEKSDEGPSDVDLFKVYLDSIAAQKQ